MNSVASFSESLQEKRAYDYVDGQKYVHPAYSVMNQPNVRELTLDVRVLPLDPPGIIEINEFHKWVYILVISNYFRAKVQH